MLFTSFIFLFFFFIIYLIYWRLNNYDLIYQNLFLLISSCCFYSFWNFKLLLLLLLIIIIDYFSAFFVSVSNKKLAKFFLILSLFNNLGILFFFKYYNFFINDLNHFFNFNIQILEIILPVGISFYTFHGMSYVIDVYYKKRLPTKNFINYALFVSFFPLLIAGPIERANHLLPQIEKKRKYNLFKSIDGLHLIIWGFFKKLFIADNLSIISDNAFNNYNNYDSISLIIGAISFSFQIYADFSAYSDIAIGLSKLLGIELLTNFNFPYFSKNIVEFWRKWHISLTSWFRDYIYIPLGGSKTGILYKYRNVFIIFFISGLWHGANWTFIFWGMLNYIFYTLYLIIDKNYVYNNEHLIYKIPKLKDILQMLFTFCCVTICWIYFRSKNITDSNTYIINIFQKIDKTSISLIHGKIFIMYISILIFLDWKIRFNPRKIHFLSNKKFSIFIIIIIIFSMIQQYLIGINKSFIYFDF